MFVIGSQLHMNQEKRDDSSTTAAMYATVTTADIAPTAGAEGGEGK
jgi:hypothetical protein